MSTFGRDARALAAATVLGLLTASCGTTAVPSPTARTSPSVASSASAPPTTSPSATSSAVPATSEFGLTPVAAGFSAPLFITNANHDSGRLFVVEQSGRIKVVSADRSGAPALFLDIAERVTSGGEQGLLGLAFSPYFVTDRQLFVDYTDLNGDTVVSRFRAPTNDRADASSEQVILRIGQPAANHNGGWIGFGPDRMLYVATGDGGGGNSENGQRLDTLLGKVLRIDVLGGRPYVVPGGNPDLGPGARPEIWLYGLRNPWRMSFDRQTGDLFIGDVGGGSQEELDVVPHGQSGLNLGWPRAEGHLCASPCPTGLTQPFYAYGREIGSVVTGGYVYRGSEYPQLRGLYFFADYAKGTVSMVPAVTALSGRATPELILQTGFAISSFGEDESGELYVADLSGGGVYRLGPKTS
jgi:glucose/arabinose dehydrogenase